MQCLLSKRPELVVVYGRRRVGKTYLIREYFNKSFSFYATGLTSEKTKGQLRGFTASMNEYGHAEKSIPADWFEAFSRLKELLESENVYREPINNKRVVFLDELPWMDTARSDFKSALDYFWNSWASAQEDIVLIVCGSATSWIITNLLTDKKGFHNRVTRRIPHYLCLFDSRLSLAQNINELCFKEHGQLANEYHNLFYSLYDKPEKHLAILDALAKHRTGLTRAELSKEKAIGGGSVLTKDLLELEECGFIRKYINCTKGEGEPFYQLIDPFVLFYIGFIKNKKFDSWNEYINTPGYNAWRGNAFEIVCINHIEQIKSALGIRGIETHEFAWRSTEPGEGAQIDLVIKRKDGVSNLCEMKFTNEEYSLDEAEYQKIENRLSMFQKVTETKDAVHVTLICGNGYKRSKYSGIVQNVIVGDDLFT